MLYLSEESKCTYERVLSTLSLSIARESTVGNLFVKVLEQLINHAQLQAIFTKYGTILSCKVAEDKGISQGVWFCNSINSEKLALTTLNSLHCAMLELRARNCVCYPRFLLYSHFSSHIMNIGCVVSYMSPNFSIRPRGRMQNWVLETFK